MKYTRRQFITTTAQCSAVVALGTQLLGAEEKPDTPTKAPVVNGAEHTWVTHDPDPRFAIDPAVATCPEVPPQHDYSGEYLLAEMKKYQVDHTVLSHVCYYGRNNAYTSHCIKKYPGKFAGIGLLVGYRLFSPSDPENPERLERLIREDGLIGLRIPAIYDPQVVWMNDPVCYPLWKKAEELGAVFNIFLESYQLNQAADMAQRFPGVNLVIDHMAKVDVSDLNSKGCIDLLNLSRHPNVYVRTSMHTLSKTQETPFRDVWPFLRKLYDRYGPRRLIWANFEEYIIMKELIPFFTAEDKEWILGRTAHRLYRFDRPLAKA